MPSRKRAAASPPRVGEDDDPYASRRTGAEPASDALQPLRPRSQRRAALNAAAAVHQHESDGDDAPTQAPGSDEEDGGDGQEKKARFVWTPDLHHRFETAVQELGVAQAKPQAIRTLMGCVTEDEPPTRQNIKSHLQKYRIFVAKQQAQRQSQQQQQQQQQNQQHQRQGAHAHQHHQQQHRYGRQHAPNGAGPSASRCAGGGGGGASSSSSSSYVGRISRGATSPSPGSGTGSTSDTQSWHAQQQQLSYNSHHQQQHQQHQQHQQRRHYQQQPPQQSPQPQQQRQEAAAPLRQQQQLGLLAQLELQAKLHETMLEQRRTQATLAWRMANSGSYEALSAAQLHRLSQHVLLQRLMMQHLYAMLHASTADLSRELATNGPPSNGVDAIPPPSSLGGAPSSLAHPSLASLSLPPNLQGAPSPTNIGGGGGGGGGGFMGRMGGFDGLANVGSGLSGGLLSGGNAGGLSGGLLSGGNVGSLSGGSLPGGLGGAGSGGLSGRLSSGGSSSGASAAAFQHLTSDDGALDGMHDALLGYFNSSGGVEGDEDGTGGLLGAAPPVGETPMQEDILLAETRGAATHRGSVDVL